MRNNRFDQFSHTLIRSILKSLILLNCLHYNWHRLQLMSRCIGKNASLTLFPLTPRRAAAIISNVNNELKCSYSLNRMAIGQTSNLAHIEVFDHVHVFAEKTNFYNLLQNILASRKVRKSTHKYLTNERLTCLCIALQYLYLHIISNLQLLDMFNKFRNAMFYIGTTECLLCSTMSMQKKRKKNERRIGYRSVVQHRQFQQESFLPQRPDKKKATTKHRININNKREQTFPFKHSRFQ